MRTRSIALSAVALLAVLMTGCGRAAGSYDPSIPVEESLSTLPSGIEIKVSKDKAPAPTPSPAIGVLVDGRWYPKDQAPTVAATPTPDAPESGKGHLHVTVSLANRNSGFVERLVVTVTPTWDAKAAFTRTFTKSELVGTKLSLTALNLDPGTYKVTVETYAEIGSALSKTGNEFTVEADKTGEAKI